MQPPSETEAAACSGSSSDPAWQVRPLIVRFAIAATVVLVAIGLANVVRSTIRPEAIQADDAWDALEAGDLRLATFLFATVENGGRPVATVVRGQTCTEWAAGYQDAALLSYQLWLRLVPELTSHELPCIEPLENWGLAIVLIDDGPNLYPIPDNADPGGLMAIARDASNSPSAYRFAAIACLAHDRGLPLLASQHLSRMKFSMDLARRQETNLGPQPPAVRSCIAELGEDYVITERGVVVPDDLLEMFPVPSDNFPTTDRWVLQPAGGIGPDGAVLSEIGGKTDG